MATVNMLAGQSVTLTAVTTKSSIDAPVLGVPVWSTSDSTKVGLEPTPDGYSCKVKSKGPTGSCTVTCTAIGGSGTISANHTISIAAVSSGLATAIVITTAGPPA